MNADNDKIRGWIGVPLNLQGIKEAYDLGEKLKDEKFDIIISSDLKRAEDTARIVSDVTKKPLEGATHGLRPWDVGHFTGKESKTVIPHMHKYVEEKPNEKVPEGESFNTFKNRFLDTIQTILKKYPNKTVLVVCHHRNNVLMDAWQKTGFKNHDVDTSIFQEKGVAPGKYKIYEI